MEQKPYDIAVSFAGEHRQCVEQVVYACTKLGLDVFYDRDMSNEWWGKSFIREQRRVYSSQTRYFVPFISTEYLTKPIPMDEFSAAMMTAVKRGDDYILPVLVGDVQVPPDLLHPHTHYLRAANHTPEQLAAQLYAKVSAGKFQGHQAREVGAVVEEALQVRLPKVTPGDFSKYEELQRIFDYLGQSYENGAPQLRPLGFMCTANRIGDRISVRVERRGDVVYSIDIYKGGNWGDDKLTFGFGHHRGPTGGINGWVEPYFDRESGLAKLKVMDFSMLSTMGSGGDKVLTKEELFHALWERMVEQLEAQP
jgi:hypothetical protein